MVQMNHSIIILYNVSNEQLSGVPVPKWQIYRIVAENVPFG